MSIAGRVRDAAVEATLAATLAGLAEGVEVAAGGRGIAIVPIVAAVATAGLFVLAAIGRLALAATVRLPIVRRWLAALVSAGAPRTRTVWRAALLFALAIVALVGPAIVVARAMPTVALGYATVPAILGTALVAAAALRIGQRRPFRWAALAVIAGVLAGTWMLAHSPDARIAILERGIASDPVAAAIRHLGDRDHDGYAGPGVGGSDCDDSDPRRNPGALDIPDNGIDENCTGADAKRVTFALRNQTRPVPPVQVRPNIVLVTIEALRADHLGAYGYARPTSPAIDALAASSVRFAHAYTSCPSSHCAIPSLLTGRYPSTLGKVETGAIPTLAQVLRRAGYVTAAITCCDRFAKEHGALAGFSTLDATADAVRMQRAGQSNADAVVDRALSWLKARDAARPYFAWIHFNSDGDRYDAEIAFVDAQLERLVAAVEPGAVVIVTSDHGEERSLYDQAIRVPLIMRVPGVAARVVDAPVSIVDLMPTLLDLAGVEGPAGMNGRTLSTALHGGAAPRRPVLVELAHDSTIKRDMVAAIDATWKVIWDRQANAWSVYRVDDVGDTSEASAHADIGALKKLLYDTLDRETGLLP